MKVKSVLELIAALNQCLLNHDPPNPPKMDEELMNKLLTDEDIEQFNKLALSIPAQIDSYRGKWYWLEHRKVVHIEGDQYITLMIDEYNDIHTIMHDGKVVWSKQI